MAIQGVRCDIGFRTGKPSMLDAVPLQNLAPWARPLEAAGIVSPKDFRIFQATFPLPVPVLLQNIVRNNRRRRVFLIESKQVGNVFWFRKGKRAHARPPECEGLRPGNETDS